MGIRFLVMGIILATLSAGCSNRGNSEFESQIQNRPKDASTINDKIHFYQNNKAVDITKLKKPTELPGYITDEELSKKGGKFVRKELMTYQEYLNLGVEQSARYDIDLNRMVWVFTSKFSQPQNFEGVSIDKAVVTTVFDAETTDLIGVTVTSEKPRELDKLKSHL